MILDTGGLTKEGAGTLTLTGNNTYSGPTTVNAGILSVNGNDSQSAVTVNLGGTLGGVGTVGPTTVFGVIAPGNAIGTLTVAGNYTQAAGSTYRTEIDPAGNSDLVNVTGAATISNGAGVQVVAAPGGYTVGQHYTILTAAGGVTGTYGTLTDNLPFVDFTLSYDPNDVYLDITASAVPFRQIAQTRNQIAAAGNLQTLSPGNALYDAVSGLDAPNALRAFDLISGEIHASVVGTLLDQSHFIRDAVLERLDWSAGASPFAAPIATLNLAEDDGAALGYAPGRRSPAAQAIAKALPPAAPAGRVTTAWAQAFGNWGHSDGDGNAAAVSRSTGGLVAGIDTTVADAGAGPWRLGVAGGYQHTALGVNDRASSAGIDFYHLAAYGGTQRGPLAVRLGSAFTWHDIDTARTVAFPGFFDAAHAGYAAQTAQAFGEIGYALAYRTMTAEPFARIAHVSVRTDGFTETGAAAALTGFGGGADATVSTLGLRAAQPLAASLTVKESVGWRHAFGTITPTAQLALAGSPSSFVVAGVPIARDAALVDLELESRLSAAATLGIAYSGQLSDRADDHSVSGRFVWRF